MWKCAIISKRRQKLCKNFGSNFGGWEGCVCVCVEYIRASVKTVQKK